MRKLTKIAAIVGVVGALAASSAIPASADWYSRHHHRYYGYYGPRYTGNGCPPGWTWQGGNCAPYKGPRGPYAPPGSRYPWQ
jgi:hypothetical protein